MDNKENKSLIEKIEYGMKNLSFKKKFKQYTLITLGVIILDIGFYFFLNPSGIVSGGTMGLAILFTPLINNAWDWFTPSIFMYIIDFIALLMGLIFLGKEFFIKTIYATILSPTVVFLFERVFDNQFFIQSITDTGTVKFVCLICGSLLAGGGVGIAIKNNGSTGGMDVFQKIISKYMKVPMSYTMYFTDWVIVLLAGFVIRGVGFTYVYQIEYVVWGSIGVIMQAYIIDLICLSIKSRRTVYVITDDPDGIKELIYKELDRGVTFANVVGAYTGLERTMVICTMDKNEAYRITSMISEYEPEAFTFVTSCKEVRGEYEKRGIL